MYIPTNRTAPPISRHTYHGRKDLFGTEPVPVYQPAGTGQNGTDIGSNTPSQGDNSDTRGSLPGGAGETTSAALSAYITQTNPILAELRATVNVMTAAGYNSNSEPDEFQVKV